MRSLNKVTCPRCSCNKELLRQKGLGGGCGGSSVLIAGGRCPIRRNRVSTVRGVADGTGLLVQKEGLRCLRVLQAVHMRRE